MQSIPLGQTGLSVSKIIFGSLTVGPCQADFSPEKGGEIIAFGLDHGITHIDTAQIYGTYPHIKYALSVCSNPDKITISSKTYAYTKQMAFDAVEEARKETGRDCIDIFLLHEQESEHTIRGHMEALEELYRLKSLGMIKAVGLSTHRISGVFAAKKYHLDVCHPLLNKFGTGIGDGTADEMLAEIRSAEESGVGIFIMKPFGGGNLLAHTCECLDYMRSLPWGFACGMQSQDEILANIAYIENGRFPENISERLRSKKRRLLIEEHCTGCGSCERRCGQDAIHIINGHAVVDENKCITCGYCGRVCPETALKII